MQISTRYDHDVTLMLCNKIRESQENYAYLLNQYLIDYISFT